jgi:predicted deacylase
LVPFSIFFQTGNDEVDAQSESLARVYDLDWIERQTLDGGVTGVMVAEAVRREKPAIVAEVGALGTYREEDIQRHMTGIRNVLQHLGLWDGEPESRGDGPPIMTGRFVVTAREGGLFYPQGQIGQRVEAGDILGEIRDPFGSLLEEVRAPAAGVLWVLFPSRVVHSGSVLYKAWTERVG